MAALEDTMWWYRGLHAALIARLDRLALSPGARILDAGCGTGGLLRNIGRVMPQFERIGVEYDSEAAAIAVAKSGTAVLNGNVNDLPFPIASFDVILSADVLCQEGVEESASLQEFLRCLKPGGSLLLSVPAYPWMRSKHDEHVHSIRRYTASGLRRLAEEVGFRVRRVGYWNSLLFPLMALHRMTFGRSRSESDVQAFPEAIDRVFYKATVLERWMEQRGVDLPFGGSVWIWATKP